MPSEIQIVRDFLASQVVDPTVEPSIAEMRQNYVAAGEAMPKAEGVEIVEAALGGVPGLKLTPANALPGRTLLYFHGGGYVIGSPRGHASMVSHIAHASRATAYSMDYRLGPEDPHPAAVEDGLAAYRGLLDTGADPAKIFIAGDSAGGGLTLATAIQIRDGGLPKPAALVPISPWVNLENESWSYHAKAESDPMINKQNIDMMAANYVNGGDLAAPLVSPVNADLSDLPPMLIQVGSEEVLLSDSTLLSERAGAAGVPVTLEVWPEMIHVFHFFHAFLSDARAAIARIGTFADGALAA